MDTLSSTSSAISQFYIAQGYFSDILNAQLTIFSLIVGVIVALYFFFNFKVSKNQIQSEISELAKQLKQELQNDLDQKSKSIRDQMAADIIKHEGMLSILRGEVYRTLGQFWDSEKSYSTAFIWWIRAALSFHEANDENMTRIALESAKLSVEKVENDYELSASIKGEYQTLFQNIDGVVYRIEKELLDSEVKKALNRKVTYSKSTDDKK